MVTDPFVQQQIVSYLNRAHRALRTGRLVLEDGDYAAAVNRAYYAVFYAASALLALKGLERSKHTGVIAAFRREFVKTGLIEAEYSDFYGATMNDRHEGDYALSSMPRETAARDLGWAERFVVRVTTLLETLEDAL